MNYPNPKIDSIADTGRTIPGRKKKLYRYDVAILRLLYIAIVVSFHVFGIAIVHFPNTIE